MEYLFWNILCFVIVLIVCITGFMSYKKGTDGREAFVFVLITSFIPYVACFYVVGGLMILITTFCMWGICKIAGTA